MKNLALLFLLGIFFATPPIISAHVLKTDGSIGAILHVDPNDAPIAGKPSTVYFDFKDRNDKFKPEDCDCTATISSNDQELFSHPHTTNEPFGFTFPKKGVYTIAVFGKPSSGDTFNEFRLEWNIRVEGESNTSGSSLIQILVGFAVLIGFLGASFVFFNKK